MGGISASLKPALDAAAAAQATANSKVGVDCGVRAVGSLEFFCMPAVVVGALTTISGVPGSWRNLGNAAIYSPEAGFTANFSLAQRIA